jgi:chemotaxis-related protein WspB
MLLLILTAGPNRYAIDTAQVVELVPRVALRLVPHAPIFLAGLLEYRGKTVPVIDLGLLLGVDACRDHLSTRIILVKGIPGGENCGRSSFNESAHDGGQRPRHREQTPELLGLVGEQASDLTYTKPEQLIPAAVRLARTPYLDAIVQTDHGTLQLLKVDKLWDAVLQERALCHAAGFDRDVPAEEPQLWDFQERETEHQGSEGEVCADG